MASCLHDQVDPRRQSLAARTGRTCPNTHSRGYWHSRLLMQLRRERCPTASRADKSQAADRYRAPSAKADRCRAPFSRPSARPSVRMCESQLATQAASRATVDDCCGVTTWPRCHAGQPLLPSPLARSPSTASAMHRADADWTPGQQGVASLSAETAQAAARRMARLLLPLSPHGP